jgi:hypothetical protein
MAALSTTTDSQLLAEALSAAAVYRSKVIKFDGKARDVTITYKFTGSPVGSLILEYSTSPRHLIEADEKGSKDGTDLATWVQYKHLFNVDGTAGHTVAISAAVTDYFDLVPAPGAAIRAKYSHTSGASDVEITSNTRVA